MNRVLMHGISSYFFYVFMLFIIILTGSCGMSADDLYTGAMEQSSNPETAGDGLKLLLEFQKRHPGDPRAPEVLLMTASLYQSLRRYGDAIEAFKELPAAYPDSPEAVSSQFLLGYLYYEDLKDTEKANTILSEFLKTHPESDLAVSAKVLLENIDTPVDEWDIIKKIESESEKLQVQSN